MARLIGCNSLHIAKVLTDSATGTTWDTPMAVPSLISIEIKDTTENVTFYSDDVTEQVIPAFSGKEVTLEMGYLTNEVLALISGNEYKNGVFIQSSSAVAKEVALLWKAPKSDGSETYACLYKGVLALDGETYKTKEESIEGQTITLNGTFMPLLSNSKVSIKADTNEDAPSDLIKTWFTRVPVPADEE